MKKNNYYLKEGLLFVTTVAILSFAVSFMYNLNQCWGCRAILQAEFKHEIIASYVDSSNHMNRYLDLKNENGERRKFGINSLTTLTMAEAGDTLVKYSNSLDFYLIENGSDQGIFFGWQERCSRCDCCEDIPTQFIKRLEIYP